MAKALEIDGSFGEGGGQILRTSLALSLVTGRPIKITGIRAKRSRPGLMRQHLAAVKGAAEVGAAQVKGDALGSTEIEFAPRAVSPGKYSLDIGSAGSCTLVLQTIMPALWTAGGPSEIDIEGGTHNPFAPPFDFLRDAFIPLLDRMGPRVDIRLDNPGFFPVGGGKIHAKIEPIAAMRRLDVLERGPVRRRSARALLSNLADEIGDRELAIVGRRLSLKPDMMRVEQMAGSTSPGNALMIEIECEGVTEVFSALGERGLSAEKVAEAASKSALDYLAGAAPIGPYLADQLLLPMALAGGGRIRTVEPTLHTRTNIEVIKRFLDIDIKVSSVAPKIWQIEFRRNS